MEEKDFNELNEETRARGVKRTFDIKIAEVSTVVFSRLLHTPVAHLDSPSLSITPFYPYLLEITPIGTKSPDFTPLYLFHPKLPFLPHFTFPTPFYPSLHQDTLEYPFLPNFCERSF
jgi:hypothetical protein